MASPRKNTTLTTVIGQAVGFELRQKESPKALRSGPRTRVYVGRQQRVWWFYSWEGEVRKATLPEIIFWRAIPTSMRALV